VIEATRKQCAACTTPFDDTTPTHNQRFCSRTCWRRAKARRHRGVPEQDAPTNTHCPVCCTSLEGRVHGTRYCTDACYQRARNRERQGLPIADPTETVFCRRCGKEAPRQGRRRIHFCSQRCRENYWANKYAQRARPILQRKCLGCAADIPPEAHLQRKYCSKKCAGRNRSTDVILRYVHARRARLAGATPQPLPKKVLSRIRIATCLYCGAPGGTVDHVVPLSRGGQHTEGNLAPACLPCNSSKRDKLLIEWRLWQLNNKVNR
jgi:endogenous inhibitor of DNA gyrase (YacG/DUF329 family)